MGSMTRTRPSPGLIGRALRGLLAALLMVSTAAAGHASPTPNPELRQPPWQPLGPLGPRRVDALAVSPDWRVDKLLLGVRTSGAEHGADLVRTRDGGRTWEALPSPAGHLVAIRLAPTPGGVPIAFAWSEEALFRSPDAGTTWQQVLAAEEAKIDDAVLSPTFGQDGLAFVLAGGVLWRSRDSGAQWDRLDPVPGQFVHRVRFSPDYAADAAVFAGLAGGPFPIGGPARTIDPAPAGDPDSSAGVVVSADAGDTWTPINEGLQVDSQGYQAIQELEVSPTFARDGALFALGWGPFETVTVFDTEAPGQRAALFRSQDRGASWESIQTFGPTLTRFHLQVAPSPLFADDHIVLEAISVTGPTPSSSNCTVAWSDDAGSNWTEKLRPGTYEGCRLLQVFGADRGFEATVLKSATRWWSPDSGRTWGYASSPSTFEPIVASPTYSQDRTLCACGAAMSRFARCLDAPVSPSDPSPSASGTTSIRTVGRRVCCGQTIRR